MQNFLEENLYICTPFFHIGGNAPNVGKSSYVKKLDTYYKCIIVFFASARRFHQNAKLVLFTNLKLPEKYSLLLEKYQVLQIIIDQPNIKYADGKIFKNNFPGCLFSLDVINFCTVNKLLNDNSVLILFDSDCIFLKSINKTAEKIYQQKGLMGIVINYPQDHNVNGQTITKLSSISSSFNGSGDELIQYYGGEFYGLSTTTIKKISSDINSLENYINSYPELGNNFTEEHILSIIYAGNKENIVDEQKTIKRVWTADLHTTIDNNEELYEVLHYPAEKKRFFKRIYKNLEVNYNFFSDKSSEELKEIALSPIQKRLNSTLIDKIRIFIKKKVKN